MHYEIRAENPSQQYVQIRAIFQVDQDQVDLQFPKWRPGRYELGNFAKNVKAFHVVDSAGNALESKKIDTHVWRVKTNKSNEIHVVYSYYAAELNAGSTFLSEEMLYVNPVNCLVFIQGLENESCSLQVYLSKKMHFAGTLEENQGLMKTNSYHDLVDSPFVYCSALNSATYTVENTTFRVSFIGINEIPWKKVLADFHKFTAKQFADFGHFPAPTFHFINIITPYVHYHGVEHRASTIIILGPSYKIFNEYYDELLGISSHELYHVWNVKSIRSADLWPYDYSRENLSSMGYLCEGITTYLGDYYLMSSGVWSPKKFFEAWEQVIQKHLDNPGRFHASLAESSLDTWLDGYAPGAPGRKTSIYNEGAIFAFITDIFIRKNTLGIKTIHDVMHFLYQQFFINNQGITDQDFIATVERISGNSTFKDLFKKLVFDRICYSEYLIEALGNIGLTLESSQAKERTASYLGLKTTVAAGVTQVQSILPDSVAEMAGFVIGDKFMAVNNFVILNDLENWLLYLQGQDLEMLLNRNGKLVRIHVSTHTKSYYLKMKIKPTAQPSESELNLFLSWTHQQKKSESL
jgi:predicted metalloprotease with PDZ domain